MKKLLSLMLACCILASFTACDTDDAKVSVETNGTNATDTAETKDDTSETDTTTEKTDTTENDEVVEKTDDTSGAETGEARIKFDTGEINFTPPTPVESIDVDFDFSIEEFDEILGLNLTPEDLAVLSDLDDEQKKKILETKAELLGKLVELIKTHELEVSINEMTGEVVLNSSILFANDKSDVSDKGKEVLKKVTAVYAAVVCDQEYDALISSIIIEGHTDTNGAYDYNKKLSLERAENVKAVCLADDVQLSEDAREKLEECLEVAGCSYDRPVKDANGNVDMDASRRVTFRFMFDLQALMGN